jgi:hypothetical protein
MSSLAQHIIGAIDDYPGRWFNPASADPSAGHMIDTGGTKSSVRRLARMAGALRLAGATPGAASRKPVALSDVLEYPLLALNASGDAISRVGRSCHINRAGSTRDDGAWACVIPPAV